MQIDLTPAEEAEIRRQASSIGYDDPAHFLVAVARELVTADATCLARKGAEMCNRGMKDADAGKGTLMREAIADIAGELGLPITDAT